MSSWQEPTKNCIKQIDRAISHWDIRNPDQVDVTVNHYNHTTYFTLVCKNQRWTVLTVRRKLTAAQEFDRLEAIRTYIDNPVNVLYELYGRTLGGRELMPDGTLGTVED